MEKSETHERSKFDDALENFCYEKQKLTKFEFNYEFTIIENIFHKRRLKIEH